MTTKNSKKSSLALLQSLKDGLKRLISDLGIFNKKVTLSEYFELRDLIRLSEEVEKRQLLDCGCKGCEYEHNFSDSCRTCKRCYDDHYNALV